MARVLVGSVHPISGSDVAGAGVTGGSLTGPGVLGASDAGPGVEGVSPQGPGMKAIRQVGLPAAVNEALSVEVETDEATGDGVGVSLVFRAPRGDGTKVVVAELQAVLDDVTPQKSSLRFLVQDAGASREVARLVADGAVGYVNPVGGLPTAGDLDLSSVSPGQMTRFEYALTAAKIAAIGAVASGELEVCTVPAGYIVHRALLRITAAATGTADLTLSLGPTGPAYIDVLVASNAQAVADYGGTKAEMGTAVDDVDGLYCAAATVIKAQAVTTDLVKTLADVKTLVGTVVLFVSKAF